MYLLPIQQNPSVMPQSVSIILQGRHWRPKSSNNCRCSCSNSKRFNDSCERHLASLASWTPLSSNKPSICHNLRQLSTQPTSQAEFCWGSLMYFVYIHHHPHQQPLSADILSFCVRKQRLWTWGLDRSHGANAKGFYDLGHPSVSYGFLGAGVLKRGTSLYDVAQHTALFMSYLHWGPNHVVSKSHQSQCRLGRDIWKTMRL